MDLGARPAKVFFLITLPIILPAIARGLVARLHAVLGRPRDHQLRHRAGLEHAADGDLLEGAPRREPGHQCAGDDPGAVRRDLHHDLRPVHDPRSRSGATWKSSEPSRPTSDAGLEAPPGRHHDLHGDVAARGRDRRDQPRPGLSGLPAAGTAAPARGASISPPGTTSTRRWLACRRSATRSRSRRCAGTAGGSTRRTEITVTAGATEAIFAAIHAVVRAGEEVILLDPSYDSYGPAAELAGGRVVHVPLAIADFGIDWQRLAQAITPRTRLLIVNTPLNPAGSVLTAGGLGADRGPARSDGTLMCCRTRSTKRWSSTADVTRACSATRACTIAPSRCSRSGRPSTRPAGKSAIASPHRRSPRNSARCTSS